MQVAEPLDLYNHPENLFVAGFIGSPPMNFFAGTVERDGGRLVFVEAGNPGRPLRISLDEALSKKAAARVGRPLVFGIRPEDVEDLLLATEADPSRTAEVDLEVVEPMGPETYLYLNTGANSFIARVRASDRFDVNRRLKVAFKVGRAHLFDTSTEQVLK
jgi:multiple sugar transport system ATP-binding protein